MTSDSADCSSDSSGKDRHRYHHHNRDHHHRYCSHARCLPKNLIFTGEGKLFWDSLMIQFERNLKMVRM